MMIYFQYWTTRNNNSMENISNPTEHKSEPKKEKIVYVKFLPDQTIVVKQFLINQEKWRILNKV